MCLAGLICLRFPSRTPLLSFLLSGHKSPRLNTVGVGGGGKGCGWDGWGCGWDGWASSDSRNQRQAWPAPGSLCCLVSGSSL